MCVRTSISKCPHTPKTYSHLTLANFCTYVMDVVSSMNTILHACIYKHMHSIMIIFFAKRESEQPKIASVQISPSPESYKIKRNVWIPRGTAPGPREVLVQGAHLQPLPERHVGDMGVYTPFSGWKGIWLLLTQPTRIQFKKIRKSQGNRLTKYG